MRVTTCPFVVSHGVAIALICSLVGPFGGFLASGFKRGCKRKVGGRDLVLVLSQAHVSKNIQKHNAFYIKLTPLLTA